VLQAQGVGAATIFFIGLGTNDAQAGVTVGWVGTAGSYIDNLYQIVSYITSHVYNPKIVLIMPEMWYTQVNTPSKTSGLATANAEYATPYRLALERYAAFAGIPLVHNPMLLGTLDPSYLNLGINQVDAVVRDNIHASGGAYRAIGMQAARAMMSLLVQNADKSLAYQPVPSGWMAASWVSGAAIYRTKDGHTKLYGTATPGTTTAGTTFMNIPSNFAPPTYMRFPCMTDNNLTAYIVVAPTGAVTLQSWPSGATYLSLDCLDWYSTTS
jgi:lysophospholipase L1-like esterase